MSNQSEPIDTQQRTKEDTSIDKIHSKQRTGYFYSNCRWIQKLSSLRDYSHFFPIS